MHSTSVKELTDVYWQRAADFAKLLHANYQPYPTCAPSSGFAPMWWNNRHDSACVDRLGQLVSLL